MDKNKFKMTGMLFGGLYPDKDILIKFMGDATVEKLLEIVGDNDFNENDWLNKLQDMLMKYSITYLMCTAETVPSIAETVENTCVSDRMQEEIRYTQDISEGYDIFIEAVSSSSHCADGIKSLQHAYIFCDGWQCSKRLDHISESSGDFFADRTYVSSVIIQDGYPKYSMDAKVYAMDEEKCVAYYDKFLMLKYIVDIDNCDELSEYAEDESIDKMEKQQP